MTITQPSILSAKSADWQSLAGLTEIAGMDIDGRVKKTGLDIAGLDNDGLDIDGLDNGGPDIDGLDIVGLDIVGLDIDGWLWTIDYNILTQ